MGCVGDVVNSDETWNFVFVYRDSVVLYASNAFHSECRCLEFSILFSRIDDCS